MNQHQNQLKHQLKHQNQLKHQAMVKERQQNDEAVQQYMRAEKYNHHRKRQRSTSTAASSVNSLLLANNNVAPPILSVDLLGEVMSIEVYNQCCERINQKRAKLQKETERHKTIASDLQYYQQTLNNRKKILQQYIQTQNNRLPNNNEHSSSSSISSISSSSLNSSSWSPPMNPSSSTKGKETKCCNIFLTGSKIRPDIMGEYIYQQTVPSFKHLYQSYRLLVSQSQYKNVSISRCKDMYLYRSVKNGCWFVGPENGEESSCFLHWSSSSCQCVIENESTTMNVKTYNGTEWKDDVIVITVQ